ncbi:site-specific integrase [Vibrio alginolyticus]|uniref:tyrosine-type recombinase/integrase n=1 Tax=Vibrio alginolyticus TaxID=663 RepID=UPI001BD285DF|nr:site-specific integrase [Vibrio alginolyticus]MBS9898127.1 site-specific integrase [Vibrio alginolyticus]
MYKRLVKGLAIYRQSHTKSIYVRLRVDGKEIKRSLKTSDIDEASSRAFALKFELEAIAKAGIEIVPTQRHTVKKACEAVIEQFRAKKPFRETYNDYIYIYNTFIIPYFKNKHIDDLTTKNIRLYFEGRELSRTRKQMNKTCFTALFNYLEEENLMKKRDFPTLPKDIKTSQLKIGTDFKENELKVIKDFVKSEEWLNQKNISFKTKEYRLIFQYVFDFLLETGMRPGEEMNHIRFSDLHESNGNIFCKIRKGKVKEHLQREVLLTSKAIDCLVEVVKITHKTVIKENQLLKMKDGFIFESSFHKVCDFCKLFDQVIKRLITANLVKTKYTLYACRHTCITNMLIGEVDPYTIAKQVGTGIDMIHKHYDHVKLKDSKNIDAILYYNKTQIFQF